MYFTIYLATKVFIYKKKNFYLLSYGSSNLNIILVLFLVLLQKIESALSACIALLPKF